MRFIITILFTLIITIIMPDKPAPGDPNGESQEQMPLFSFGLIADIQYCDCDPVGTRYFRSSIAKLEEAVRSFRIDSPAFVVNLGDMIEKEFDSYKSVYSILDTAGFKVYNLTGNHDYSVEPRQKKRIPPLQSDKTGYFFFCI
ncbi:MAG: hypothetical protein C0408_08365 [Odoribacter sp.]|nr:hypothetical protein [Odoribacter sp.]